MKREFDLSIIIVSYNTKKLTIDCIDSIVKYTKGLTYEIIVVDNNSTDGSVQGFQNLIKVIKNKKNLGYAVANNQGITVARGNAILILNSDTKIIDNSIFEAWKKLKEVDVLTIRLIDKKGKNQQAGGYGPNILNLFWWTFFLDDLPFFREFVKPYQISDLKFFERDHDLDWVMGAFMMIKSNILAKTGLLDEKIFMYGEEMEFCRRVKNHSLRIKYFAKPAIIHYGCGSSESGEKAIIGEYQALIYFFQKYGNKTEQFIVYLLIKISIILRVTIFGLMGKPNKKHYAKAFLKV